MYVYIKNRILSQLFFLACGNTRTYYVCTYYINESEIRIIKLYTFFNELQNRVPRKNLEYKLCTFYLQAFSKLIRP